MRPITPITPLRHYAGGLGGAAGGATGSAASGGAASSVLGGASGVADVTFAPLITDAQKEELKNQKREVFANAVHKRGESSKFRKQIYNLNLHLRNWYDETKADYRAKHAAAGGVPWLK